MTAHASGGSGGKAGKPGSSWDHATRTPERPSGLAAVCLALVVAGCGQPGADVGGFEAKTARRLADPAQHKAFLPDELAGLFVDERWVPEDNPITLAKVELGRQLYFDTRLSRDSTVSCATCHDPKKGWTDQAPVSTGIRGQKGGRSAPTVMNRLFSRAQFWDGRAASLEEQALGPIGNPIEMGFTVDEAVVRLNGIAGYKIQFEKVFGGPASPDRIAKAIAAFERTVLAGGAPNDYYERAEPFLKAPEDPGASAEEKARRSEVLLAWQANKMSEAALRGREVYFGKGQCSLCHVGPNLADELYHNLGVGMDKPDFDKGREDFTKKEADRGAFKTPTLRNIKDTAPYMHDGSQKTLAEVVEFYDKGGHKNPWLSPKVKPLGLTVAEKADLVRFMEEGLQGKVTPVDPPELPPG